MARLGFYNIKTIECLSRQINTRHHQFYPLSAATTQEAAAATENTTNGAENGEVDGKSGPNGKKIAQSRKQKLKEKESKKVSRLVTMPQAEARGHTGYLTFATKF